ncbi:MAG: histidine phosphotransferase ChpT [Caulobacterales bacterium]|uniref:histidine phosphotransferase ChpT n=1 Tax=Glycocaulis sp. TaxID=1969725 RepID=UPI003FA00CC4
MSTQHTPTASELAALLCARLCHDLVSPVSALGAALSVLDDENAADMRDDAIELIRTGANQAHAKLEFVRLAFGAGGSRPGSIDTGELKRLAEAMFASSKPDLVWKVQAAGLDKPAARVLLNLVWMAVDNVPRGGTVTVEATASDAGDSRLKIVAAGPRARIDPAYVEALAGRAGEDGYDGRSIQPYYAGLIAREHGGRVEARAEEERIEYVALLGAQASVQAA